MKHKDWQCCLEYTNTEDDLLIYKCLCYKKIFQIKFDEDLKKSFANTYKFCHCDINKFTFMMKKGIYPYEYMEDWKKVSETLLSRKEKIFTATQTWKIVLM